MNNSHKPDSFSHWSDYWAGGALTSLPQDFAGNYDGEVADFWHARLAEISHPGRVLDLCTGNGPIALLAASWAHQHAVALDIVAVDAAQPRPEQVPGLSEDQRKLLETVEFHAGTPIEALPFADGSFDLITSQYGLEYCDLDRAAGQVSRLLRPGGVLAIVAHAADSAMIETMQDELAGYQLLDKLRLVRLLRSWGRGQLADPDFVRRTTSALTQLQRDHSRQAGSPLVAQAGQAVYGLLQMSAEQRRSQRPAAAAYADQLHAGQARLADMLRVNQKISENPNWHQPLKDAGLVLRASQVLIYRGEHAMGQAMEWFKPA